MQVSALYMAEMMGIKMFNDVEAALFELAREGKVEIADKSPHFMFRVVKSDIFWLAYETKAPAVNIAGYSKLLIDGRYGKLNKKQKETFGHIVVCVDELMLCLNKLQDATSEGLK